LRAGLVVAGCAIALSAGSAQNVRAADIGDPAAGMAYAQANCASCHGINRDSKSSPVPEATTFRVFANTPGVNRTAMIVFLRTPHPTMPNLVVTGDDADDVIAYILSLKGSN
jgi:mono/diheme cytochrome c family protein